MNRCDLFMKEAYRGKGVGSLLMRFCARLSHSLGCCRLDWHVDDWNAEGKRFYRHVGGKHKDTRMAMDAATCAQFGHVC